MIKMDKYNKKILQYKKKDIYIIFYSPWCQYCQKTFDLLNDKKISYKAYNIDKIDGGIQALLNYLNKENLTTSFNKSHTTRPIIFYHGKFVGGYSDLMKKLT